MERKCECVLETDEEINRGGDMLEEAAAVSPYVGHVSGGMCVVGKLSDTISLAGAIDRVNATGISLIVPHVFDNCSALGVISRLLLVAGFIQGEPAKCCSAYQTVKPATGPMIVYFSYCY